MSRWLLQCFKKRIEGTGTKHVNLVDDVNPVSSRLRSKTYLFYQFSNIINRVITRGIQFINIEGSTCFETNAAVTGITCLPFRCWVAAVDGFGQYACAGCFSYTAWTTK